MIFFLHGPAVKKGFFLFFGMFLLVAGCGRKTPVIADLARFPQQASVYGKGTARIIPADRQRQAAEYYVDRFFSPWKEVPEWTQKETLVKRYRAMALQPALGENLQPLGSRFFNELIDNADLAGFPSRHGNGITVAVAQVRVLPTARPFFLERCGPDGYPFDLFQESTLWPGTPVKVRHRSLDRRWLFIETAFLYGWVAVSEVTAITESQAHDFLVGPKVTVTEDRFPFYAATGDYLGDGRIGMMLPAAEEGALFPVRGENGVAWAPVITTSGRLAPFPLPMTTGNAARIIGELSGQPYGWGGLYQNRDCSSLARDYFASFGIWLPRNSSKQCQTGRAVSLAGLGRAEKEALILAEGDPFLHLVGRPGHVALYVGEYHGEAVFFHALWGIRIGWAWWKPKGRLLVGKSVFTGAQPGFEHPRVRWGGRSLLEGMDYLIDPSWVGDDPLAP